MEKTEREKDRKRQNTKKAFSNCKRKKEGSERKQTRRRRKKGEKEKSVAKGELRGRIRGISMGGGTSKRK